MKTRRLAFKHFIKTSTTTTSAGITSVKRCARGLAGDWRFFSISYDGYPQLAPGTSTTTFKPKPGC